MKTYRLGAIGLLLLAIAGVPGHGWAQSAARERTILFDSDRAGRVEIFALDPGTSGPPRQLTTSQGKDASSTFPTWSPDGRSIAFTLTVDGNADVAVMDSQGSTVRRLTTAAAADLYPAWSPDGRRIAFVSARDGNREIYVMRADGSEARRVTVDAASDVHPQW
jgi:TolB protein